jgi:hypothetical protein
VDRFYEILEGLNFHAQELKSRLSTTSFSSLMPKECIDLLLVLAVNNLKKTAKNTLLDPFPA